MGRMLALAGELGVGYRRAFLGKPLDVLWEEKVKVEGVEYWSGLSDNYIRAYASDSGAAENEITRGVATNEVGKGLLMERVLP